MLDFHYMIERFEGRHQELLEAAAQTRRHRNMPGSRNGAWLLALAAALERISAAIRARHASNPHQTATNAATAWRTS